MWYHTHLSSLYIFYILYSMRYTHMGHGFFVYLERVAKTKQFCILSEKWKSYHSKAWLQSVYIYIYMYIWAYAVLVLFQVGEFSPFSINVHLMGPPGFSMFRRSLCGRRGTPWHRAGQAALLMDKLGLFARLWDSETPTLWSGCCSLVFGQEISL